MFYEIIVTISFKYIVSVQIAEHIHIEEFRFLEFGALDVEESFSFFSENRKEVNNYVILCFAAELAGPFEGTKKAGQE